MRPSDDRRVHARPALSAGSQAPTLCVLCLCLFHHGVGIPYTVRTDGCERAQLADGADSALMGEANKRLFDSRRQRAPMLASCTECRACDANYAGRLTCLSDEASAPSRRERVCVWDVFQSVSFHLDITIIFLSLLVSLSLPLSLSI